MPAMMPLPPELSGLDVEAYMREALAEAEAAGVAGELPIGAVLVVGGVVVSRGRARHRASRSQVMHAEMQALLHGGDPLWESYHDAVLFTTVEPCPMCLGATVMADVPHIVFALPDAVAGSRCLIEASAYIRRHIRTYHGSVLADDSRALLARFDPSLLAYVQTGSARTPEMGLASCESSLPGEQGAL